MAEFETVKAEVVNYGNNNFLEIARKKVVDKSMPEGKQEKLFISLSKGYYLPDGSRRYKDSFTVPDIEEVKSFIIGLLGEM